MNAPWKKFELPVLAGVKLEMLAGVMARAWPTFTTPMFCIWVESMTVVGVGVVKSVVRLMREPVTVTSSRAWGWDSAAVVAGVVCASACGAQVREALSDSSNVPAAELVANLDDREPRTRCALAARRIVATAWRAETMGTPL